jgi:hypothetical protein
LAGSAHIEVEVVGELERENVARVFGEDAIENFAGPFELPVAPCAKRAICAFSLVALSFKRGMRMRAAFAAKRGKPIKWKNSPAGRAPWASPDPPAGALERTPGSREKPT